MNVAVLGAGAWGTALACALAPRQPTVLFARDSAQALAMQSRRVNARYLPEVTLPPSLAVVDQFEQALDHAGSDVIIVATPTRALRDVARQLNGRAEGAGVVWLCKGFEEGTERLPHQILLAELGEARTTERTGPLSGPSFALEVARGLPTALTVAGQVDFCEQVTNALHGEALRIYSTDDVIGVEIGGAVKNVLAIATGISDALNLGLNARAALITRGLAEMSRLGIALGARADTFMGLTGLGDLILTATGELSRNRRVGLALGAGRSTATVVEELGHVAEGVRSAHSVLGRAAQVGIEMPITAAVCAVLDGRLKPTAALSRLLAREPRAEGLDGA
ncbi:MAG: NAD(P)H-dependent glycerol-3-phosphate dehydrogenase [Burkholderiaceae bacterium]